MDVRAQRLSLLSAIAVPVTVTLLIYAGSLHSAYRIDDLAWLSLRNTLTHGRSLAWALFSPQAQGSIRPLGERVWFLLASSMFPVNQPLPLHLLALLTQLVNVVLMILAGRRLLGSLTAASIAATLWVMNDSLTEAIVWASAYNEVLYTCWFLLAFICLFRWIDTNRTIWLTLHIAAIVLGLCTNELMVTFPLIAAAFVWFFARQKLTAVLPSSGITLLFIAIHMALAPLPRTGAYQLSAGWGVAANLFHYWTTILGPSEYGRIFQASPHLVLAATILMSIGAVLWIASRIQRRQWTPLFCAAWFLGGMIPIALLQNHFTLYYAFLPLIGLGWLAGGAITQARSTGGRIVGIACLILYAGSQIPSTIFVRDWNSDRSHGVEIREKQMLDAVRQIRRLQPSGPVFLTGLDTEQFWWGLCYGELSRYGFSDLHILPDAGQSGVAIPPKEWCRDTAVQLPSEETERLIQRGSAGVYDIRAVPVRRAGAQ